MDTLRNRNQALIEQTGANDYVILCESLEFAMAKRQLAEITKLNNEDYTIEEISEKVKRNEFEVVIALLHQAYQNRVFLKPIRVRPSKTKKKRKQA